MKINILTAGFLSPTARGWLYPLIAYRLQLLDMGIQLDFYTKNHEKLKYCDIVIVESKFIKDDLLNNKIKVFEFLSSLKTKDNLVFIYDLGDSTYSWSIETLPYIDKLLKPFIFKDKMNYTIPLEGCNLISSFYFEKGLISKEKIFYRKPKYVKDKKLLNKIQVGYNGVFSNFFSKRFSLWNMDILSRLFRKNFKLYCELIKYHSKDHPFVKPDLNKKINLSCRLSVDNYSNGINYHRKEISKITSKYNACNLISRKNYINEISNSKIVVSPFGWGEINIPRDYEAAIKGSLLIKPDISHLETWPNIFNKNTIIQHKWDFSDLPDLIEMALGNYDHYINYSIELQNQFKDYTCPKFGVEKFYENFLRILKK